MFRDLNLRVRLSTYAAWWREREREREREHRRVLKVRTRPQSGLRAAIAAATGRIENDRARERTLISRRVSPFLSTRRAIAIFEKFARTDFPNYGEGFKHPCALTISIFYCRAYEIIHFKRRVERRAKNWITEAYIQYVNTRTTDDQGIKGVVTEIKVCRHRERNL